MVGGERRASCASTSSQSGGRCGDILCWWMMDVEMPALSPSAARAQPERSPRSSYCYCQPLKTNGFNYREMALFGGGGEEDNGDILVNIILSTRLLPALTNTTRCGPEVTEPTFQDG